ncbi:hypothetical protein [Caballeronia ptereochthonis]|uniref:hypothetical protein n=1 Tax=Caballeronia ptereochthonis TaxID=1777144 RepID=UPI00117E2E31|nr:hypothetical protein [Caballeronia ptereochthonis]
MKASVDTPASFGTPSTPSVNGVLPENRKRAFDRKQSAEEDIHTMCGEPCEYPGEYRLNVLIAKTFPARTANTAAAEKAKRPEGRFVILSGSVQRGHVRN